MTRRLPDCERKTKSTGTKFAAAAYGKPGCPQLRRYIRHRSDLKSLRHESPLRSSLPFCLLQPLGHLLVVAAVARRTRRVAAPTVILDRHVDAAVDEVLHRLVRVRQEHQT